MKKFTVSIRIRIRTTSCFREPEYKVAAHNSVEALVLGVLRAGVSEDLGENVVSVSIRTE